MATKRLFNVLAGVTLVLVVAFTVREVAATYAFASTGGPREVQRNSEAARWKAMANQYAAEQSRAAFTRREAETTRWTAIGNSYAGSQRAQAAATARWTAMAAYYTGLQAQAAQRAQAADAARWTALGAYYGARP